MPVITVFNCSIRLTMSFDPAYCTNIRVKLMYQVDVPIDFQQTLAHIYGEEAYRVIYKSSFPIYHPILNSP